MKLTVKGDINAFYVQTLCMIFFPGEKFSQDQEITEDVPVMEVSVINSDTGSYAKATLINLESKIPPADKKHQIRKNFKQICPNKLNGSAL